MLYTLTNGGLQNGRPTATGVNEIIIDNRATHIFTLANFTTETNPVYSDPEGDDLAYIQITSLPSDGVLYLSGVAVSVGDNISSGDLSLGNFTFEAPDQDEYDSDSFGFDVADEGSSSLSGLNTGAITIIAEAAVNLPPDVVGDNAILMDYSETYTFTSDDFTTNTTPAYNDPEGDAAQTLKVLTLPGTGVLNLNGSPVSTNDEILFTEIAAGYFTYIADSATTDSYVSTFDFSIADSGSGEFTE